MKEIYITSLFVCVILFCQAQYKEIDYNHFYSKQFPTRGCTSLMFERCGPPLKVKKLTFYVDTILAFSYNPKEVTYWSLNDTFRLHYVYFDNNVVLFYDTLKLWKKTKIKNIIDYFNIPLSEVDSTLGCMTPLNCRPRQKILHVVVFDKTSIPKIQVELFFNKRRKLMAVYFLL